MVSRYACFIMCLMLAGCGGMSASQQPRGPQPIAFDGYLWQAARETLDFLPLQKTDPNRGAIETGWGSPKGDDAERYLVSVQLDYHQIYADAATITVLRQLHSGDGWTDVGPDAAAAALLAKAIGDRAGKLRAGSARKDQ